VRRPFPAFRNLTAYACAAIAALAGVCAGPLGAQQNSKWFVWPTPLHVTAGTDWESFVQAAASGDPATGLFGIARNNGSKFHEGVDIRPASRDRRGEPADTVVAALDGRVVHTVLTPNGPYGRYVVLAHEETGLRYYTLYAHLRSVHPALKPGLRVEAGYPLGIMGRSDEGRGFPKDRAHLHFEVGVRLSISFDKWYAHQKMYSTPNRHGAWNGINLAGTDPLPFLRAGLSSSKPPSCVAILRDEPAALAVHVFTSKIPDFVRENPALLTTPLPPAVAGWRIEFAWHGLPLRWTPLTVASSRATGLRSVSIAASTDSTLRQKALVRGMLERKRNGSFAAGSRLLLTLGILFDW
jgi:hypothetical protein